MLCPNHCRIYKGEADVFVKQWVRNKRGFDKMTKFVEQAAAKGHDATILEKIWKDWEAFAELRL
jgi:DNA polymerase-3 subunit alpha